MRSCATLSHVLMATAMSKGAELGLRSEGGSESSSMIVLQVLFPRMEHQTKRKRRRAFGGCGRWRLIPDTADNRTTPVEGIGRSRKRGWSVVCEYLRASQRVQSPAGKQIFFFFFENPRTPGGPTSSGSVIKVCDVLFRGGVTRSVLQKQDGKTRVPSTVLPRS